MATTYKKVSELSAASALAGTEPLLAVQSGDSVYATPAQINTYVRATPPAGVTATSAIIGEYIFDEDSELVYTSSFSDGMGSATITFTELPSNTCAIFVELYISDTAVPVFICKRTAGGTNQIPFGASFADGGSNYIRGTYWIPTDGNTLYAMTFTADVAHAFVILGYKVKAA